MFSDRRASHAKASCLVARRVRFCWSQGKGLRQSRATSTDLWQEWVLLFSILCVYGCVGLAQVCEQVCAGAGPAPNTSSCKDNNKNKMTHQYGLYLPPFIHIDIPFPQHFQRSTRLLPGGPRRGIHRNILLSREHHASKQAKAGCVWRVVDERLAS